MMCTWITASTNWQNIKFLRRERGPGHVILVENSVTPPSNQTAEAKQFKFGKYVNHVKY